MERPVKNLLEDIGESIDRLITVDVCAPYILRGSIAPVYEAARDLVGKPLTLAAAEELKKLCTKDSLVIISSGFVLLPYLPHGESDGPIGAAALARAINKAFGSKILLLTEKVCIPSLKAACAGAGILTLDPDVAKEIPSSITIREFPIDIKGAQREAEEIFEKLDPAAMITIEKVGRNSKGIYHTSPGGDMSESTAKVDILFDMLRENNKLTIGIGDYGNEIGLGSLIEAVKKIAPTAIRCKCPCGGGIVTIVKAKIPVVAAISNWGANGIIAALALLLNDFSILHDPQTECRMIEQACLSGACDGVTVKPSFSVDGITIEGHMAMNRLLHEVIRVKTLVLPFIRK